MWQVLCQLSGINSIVFYAADILRDAGVSNVNVGAALIQTVQLVVTLASAPLVDRLGRRTMYCAAAGTCAVAAASLSAAYFLEAQGRDCNSVALASLFVYISGFALGFGGIPWVMMGELVPTSVRVKVTSLATATNWSTSWAVTASFDGLVRALGGDKTGAGGTFALYAGLCAANVLFMLLVVPETRGRALEQTSATAPLVGEQ